MIFFATDYLNLFLLNPLRQIFAIATYKLLIDHYTIFSRYISFKFYVFIDQL
jgi:hypothetical protein